MFDKTLIKDCLDWFRAEPGLAPPPDADQARIIGPAPNATISQDEAESVPVSRRRFVWALVHSLTLCAALVLVLMAWADWNSPLVFVLTTLVFTLCYGFPVALAVSFERLAVPESETSPAFGPGAQPAALARTLALALYNSSPARRFLHVCVDILLFPLFLSCQEGVAEWAARGYCRDRDLPLRRRGLRARISALPLALLERFKGPKAVAAVVRYL